MAMKLSKDHGFSLIELLIVITIVGILVAIAVPVYKNYSERAKMDVVYNLIAQLKQTWLKENDIGDWHNWGISDRYPPVPVPSVTSLYVNWYGFAVTFNPGYFNRLGPTYVNYTPILDGQLLDVNGSVNQLAGVKTIGWSCSVSGPASVYAEGLTVHDFQLLFFPQCDCPGC